MSDARINIGVAGMGNIGKAHLECLADAYFRDRVAQIRIADPDVCKQKEFAGRSARIDFVADFRDLTDCDIIIIALPTTLHLNAIRHFSGKAGLLLIEKPLGLSHGEATEIVEILTRAKQRAMCGLTGLYHPEFQSMYQQLGNVGDPLHVSETLHEADPQFGQYLARPKGVLTENGVHTLHRFLRIAGELFPGKNLAVERCEMATREFIDCPGEDVATGRLRLDGGPAFDFDVAFRNGSACDNGLPVQYVTIVEGSRGVVRVTGWEKCESTIDGKHFVHYEHPDGPLNGRSQYRRIQLGMRNQLDACLQFLGSTDLLHFTIDEAARAQELIEACYGFGHG